ncbi:hypothetical protein V8E53_002978 [Lactarius tabidus]
MITFSTLIIGLTPPWRFKTPKRTIVRNARRSIIEPVLASFDLSSDSSSDGEQQVVPDPAHEKEEPRRIRLRNKGGLILRASGVHVRRDIGDESADFDIATTDGVVISLPSTIHRIRKAIPHIPPHAPIIHHPKSET